MDYDTLILHNGNDKDELTGALSIPVYRASTYYQKNIETKQKYLYSRSGNPTREALEKTIAVLEAGKYGFAFASGMAVISTVILSLVKSNEHIIFPLDIYGGTYKFAELFLSRYNIEHSFIDMTEIEKLKACIKENTKIIYIETPSNPLLKITDIEAVVKTAKDKNIITVIDNTFMTPYFLKPLTLGVDVTLHSATKFLGGHSDIIAGLCATNSQSIAREIALGQNTFGSILSPDDSWLLLRGIKTLSARMKMQSQIAKKIAGYLKKEKWVTGVYYPGLEDHAGHSLIKSQCSGFGAVLSFKCDTIERTKKILKNTKLWSPAVSLGGVESIISYPYIMSHGAMPEEEKEKRGITKTLLRLSPGLEDPDDLIEDLVNSAK